MTQREIFERIVRTAAESCGVSFDDIMTGRLSDDVVTARSVSVFWLNAASFSVSDIMACTGRKNHNSIDSIKANIEPFWRDRFKYHMLVLDAGRRLLDYAHTIGEDFDAWKPIARIQAITGKTWYKYNPFA